MPLLALSLKKTIHIGVFGLAVFGLPLRGSAVPIEAVPNPRQNDGGWVTDMADILNSTTEAEINRSISELEAQNGSEIAVVTVPDTAPSATPKEFATALFNHWGIGKKGEDNGVLFLISQGDRRVEIETGYGVESILPDAQVGNIIERNITPRFKQGDFNGGTLAGTQALIVALKGKQASAIANEATRSNDTPRYREPKYMPSGYRAPGYIYWLGGIGAVGIAIARGIAANKKNHWVFLTSQGQTRANSIRDENRNFQCVECKQAMKKLDETELQSYLSKPQQVAQEMGSMNFTGWQCPQCHSKLTGLGIHLFTRVLNSKDFCTCPTCQELTANRRIEKIVAEPTWNKEGQQLANIECQCCSHRATVEESIPRLTPPADAVFIQPTGRSRVTDSRWIGSPESKRASHCTECKYPMEQLDSSLFLPHLSRPERIAHKLGSVKFMAWKCPNCSQQVTGSEIHIRAYVLNSLIYKSCPTCEELTVVRTEKVVQSPTPFTKGKRSIAERCYCCSYYSETEQTLPCLPSSPSRRSSSWSAGSSWSGSDFGGGGFSGGGSSGGGGDFGGGDSGGGGAGGSW